VTDSRVQRDHRSPIRLGAAGAVAAGIALGLELGLLIYWNNYFRTAGNTTVALIAGAVCALTFGLFFYFRGVSLPRHWR
jgi:hypothetical protein